MWLLFAFASAFFAGVTSILAKIGIKNTDSDVVTAVRTIVVVIFSWIMVFVAGSFTAVKNISVKSLVFLVLSGLATGASWLCYYKALQLGDINKVTPIDKSSTILTMILAFLILGEDITLLKLTAMAFMGAGTYLMVAKKAVRTDGAQTQNKAWLIYALLSAVFASFTSILGKIGISGVESNLGTAVRTVVVLIMSWLVVLVKNKLKQVKEISRQSMIFIFLSAITTGLSWLCYYRALQSGRASVVAPIDKLSILVTVIFSYVFFKEKLSLKAFLGLCCLVGGTLLLLL